ncbi:unnamed protein product [Linum trigynum]|uniref:Uncharacterized protein n=1 Tax=Linum trigynum TaxID=586398 RepID=A0AAV2CBC7_9ROSI
MDWEYQWDVVDFLDRLRYDGREKLILFDHVKSHRHRRAYAYPYEIDWAAVLMKGFMIILDWRRLWFLI